METKAMWGEISKILGRKKRIKDNGTILVVESNPADRHFFCRILEKEKYTPVTSERESVIRMAAEVGPRLVILNSVILGVKSLDLCAKLKSSPKTKKVPIMIVATKGDDSNIMEYYSNNADCYLMKPIGRKEFIDQVKSLIMERK